MPSTSKSEACHSIQGSPRSQRCQLSKGHSSEAWHAVFGEVWYHSGLVFQFLSSFFLFSYTACLSLLHFYHVGENELRERKRGNRQGIYCWPAVLIYSLTDKEACQRMARICNLSKQIPSRFGWSWKKKLTFTKVILGSGFWMSASPMWLSSPLKKKLRIFHI